MKKKSENSHKSVNNNNLRKLLPKGKEKAVKKEAGDHGVSDDLHESQIKKEEAEEEVDNEVFLKHDSYYSASDTIQEFVNQKENHTSVNLGITCEKVDITSSRFESIYFKSFKRAIAVNIALAPIGWFVGNRHPLGALAFPVLSFLWVTGRILIGYIRKNGLQVISGWGWIAGMLSIIATLVTLFFVFGNIFDSTIKGLLILLAGTIFVGLLINVPPEISIELNKRRVRLINAHVIEWGEEVCQAIIGQEVQPGMTKEMVLLSCGNPTVIENREAIKNYLTEKWVYKSSHKPIYIWFVNGVVNKINDTGV